MAGLTRRLLYYVWGLAASIVIVTAVLITAMRVLLPFAEDFRVDVEQWAGEIVGQNMTIEGLQSHWGADGPVLSLQGVTLLGSSGDELLRLDEARIGIDFFGSLLNFSLLPDEMRLVGGRFAVIRRLDGSHQLAGVNVSSEAKAAGGSAIGDWLFSRAQIKIWDSAVHWRDERSVGEGHLFEHVNLTLRNDGGRHQFDVTIAQNVGQKETLRIAADLEGNPFGGNQWQGQIYVKGQGLAPLLRDLIGDELPMSARRLDVELWGEWLQAQLKGMEGHFTTEGIRFDEAGELPLLGAAGRFHLKDTGNGWRLFVPELKLKQALRSWDPFSIDLYYSHQEDQSRRVVSRVSGLQMADGLGLIRRFKGLDQDISDALGGMMPAGIVDRLAIELRLPKEKEDDVTWKMEGRLADLTTAPWNKFPGLDGFDAALYMTTDEAVIDLEGQDAWADFPQLFRQPIFTTDLTGQVQVKHDPQGWRLSAPRIWARNDDVATLTDLQLYFPSQGEAWMDLQTVYQDGDIKDAHLYYPVGIMDDGLLDWLEASLIDGELVHGGAAYRGPFTSFPFKGNQGRFEVGLKVAGLKFDYDRQWPGVEKGQATLRFDQTRFEVSEASGVIFDTALTNFKATIPDLTQSRRLYLSGNTTGSASDTLDYTRNSPLGGILGHIFDPVKGSGDVAIDLGLQIPLQGNAEVKVDGQLTFKGNTLDFTQWQLPLKRISGEVSFTERGVASKRTTGRLFGGDIEIVAERVELGDSSSQSRLSFVGYDVDVAPLAAGFKVPLGEYLSGRSTLNGHMEINHGGDGDVSTIIKASSDMVGSSIDLPEPMAKDAEAVWPTEVEYTILRNQTQQLRTDLHDRVTGMLEFKGEPSHLWRGGIRMGNEVAELPSESGLWVTGDIPYFSLYEWQPIVMKEISQGDGKGMDLWRAVNVSLGILDAPGIDLHDATVSLKVTPLLWFGEFGGDEGSGTVSWPQNLASDIPLTLRMGRLQLPPRDEQSSPPVLLDSDVEEQRGYPDPRDMPSLFLTIDRLYMGDAELGSLRVETSRSSQGQHINTFSLKSDDTEFRATGDWLVRGRNEQHTRMKISMDSSDFGDHLDALGYPDTLTNGKGRIEGQLNWSAPPYCWSPESLGGQLNVKLSDGRIVEAQPGGGRLLGLLSLYTLPRRLILDFSDLFGKGLTFDSWEGSINIEQGLASTNEMVVDGPAAHIAFAGDADLVSREVDQIVEMLPRISGTLPLLGALTGGTSGGVFMLLFESIFGKSVNKSAKVTYRVNGSWDEPEVVKLESPKSEAVEAPTETE